MDSLRPSSFVTQPAPLKAGEKMVYCWTLQSGTKKVCLIRDSKNDLIGRLFDTKTKQSTSFKAGQDAQDLVNNHFPRIIGLSDEPIVFVPKLTPIQGWQTSDYRNIELLPSQQKWVIDVTPEECALVEVDTFVNEKQIPRLLKECTLQVKCNEDGVPLSIVFLPYVHTWNLGKYKVHLVRSKNETGADTLSRQIIFNQETFNAPIGFHPMSIEERIQQLKRFSHPIIIPEHPPRLKFAERFHGWTLMDGTEVKLLQDHDRLKCEIISAAGELTILDLDCPGNMMFGEFVECLKTQYPILIPEVPPRVRFVKHVSQLDDQVELTRDTVAITVVNGRSARGNEYNSDPSTWYGHASIRIEGLWKKGCNHRETDTLSCINTVSCLEPIMTSFLTEKIEILIKELNNSNPSSNTHERPQRDIRRLEKTITDFQSLGDNNPFMIKCHFTDNGVYIETVKNFRLSDISGKTQSWVKEHLFGARLIKYGMRSDHMRGRNLRFMLTGNQSLLDYARQTFIAFPLFLRSVFDYGLKQTIIDSRLIFEKANTNVVLADGRLDVGENVNEYHNCITWVKKLLEFMNIDFPKKAQAVGLNKLLLITPKDYILSTDSIEREEKQ